ITYIPPYKLHAKECTRMKKSLQRAIVLLVAICVSFSLHVNDGAFAKKEKKKEEKKTEFTLPKNVLSIEKANTPPNTTIQLEMIEPSKTTKELLESVDIPIENIHLIKMLNETSIKPSPVAIGYRGSIYLGRWPLMYQSESTSVN